ncbi:amidohydrolase family protein [Hyphomicrobium sp. CS1BSMeth3]|uniref:amidohydrolase family protein n=1 Tax=Hyphomicrobium sp. CS1BSMeth3 TaxID=1892844 RepID=UPI001FCCC229|nr:amidohydrolase family protein [Hyphomicrobium sp. CS1BSMeth3]
MAIDPELPVVDTHHHIWTNPLTSYRADDVVADANAGHRIVATVFVDSGVGYRTSGPRQLRPVGETEFAASVAENHHASSHGGLQLCAAIVSHANLANGAAVEEVLLAHIAAGGGRFRGIRHLLACDPHVQVRVGSLAVPGDQFQNPAFREGFARLGKLRLSFDAWVLHSQLPAFTEFARSFPDTSIVLNHCGCPLGVGPYAGKRDEVFKIWREGIRAVAAEANVTVKLGGLGMHLLGFDFDKRADPPSSDTLASAWRPYVDTCIEAFGTQRAMFESNFPVDRRSCSYTVLWNAFKKLTTGASADERVDLFSATACRIYDLTPAWSQS